MDSRDLVVYVAGGIALAVLIIRLVWKSLRRGANVSPVSERWLAERRAKRTPD